MKILVIPTVIYRRTGIGIVVRNLYCNDLFSKEQINFVLFKQSDEMMISELESYGYTVSLSGDRLHHPIKYMFFLYKYMKKEKFDIIHVHGNSGINVIELIPAVFAGIKVRIMHSHANSCKYRKVHIFLKPLLNLCCNGRFACSKAAGEFLFDKKKTYIIKNAFDVTPFCFDKNIRLRLRENYGFDNELIFGNVGTLTENKNQKYIINVFNEYHKINNNSVLIILGEGTERTILEKQISDLNLTDCVFLEGNKKNVNEYLNMFDVFLFPSKKEGFGIAPVEAQINGLPVISSDTVPYEIRINDNVFFLPLSSDLNIWVKKILEMNFSRVNTGIENANKAGLILDTVINYMYSLYTVLLNRKK